ncbi:excinuclease ABC subunit UvrA [Enterococcus sp. DIV0242_7C1]|uniref:UvrABC system protein A n=1 Tax=Candidatus Enterococcus dunnyi TaxID=1834192 RepID=A0A200IVJ9_9ENTE|nr:MULTISPECIES: excinuclease ABC subunit UvrA [unclassified Enterococcus]MBO0471198.1 excinuclease ABC subunit UvrA [Enterococcus sp. DIV0242_7C1]OUZ28410.1 excinuclease ABC subunit A [Enterococcus sp. 9D6_DIV0238]
MTEYVVINGARENNLKNVSVSIPKRKITVFTGVSGSGKSSIVFETIANESQRQLNETFSAFVQNFLPKYQQPDVDSIENLATSVVINQKRLGGNSRSTLGTITDINPLLRVLFSRFGQPSIGTANYFSFNDQAGMCPKCQGIGKTVQINEEKFLDRSRSLNDGAVQFSVFKNTEWYMKGYLDSGLFDNDKKIEAYTEEELENLLYAKDFKIQVDGYNLSYEGLFTKFNRLYLQKEGELTARTQKLIEEYTVEACCPLCKGKRLSQESLAVKVAGHSIADLMAMEVTKLMETLKMIQLREAQPVLNNLQEKIGHLVEIGLGYLSLDRATTTLSGGESQRVKMVKHLNNSLVDLIYIFDEPSIGLHPRDVHRLNELLFKLRDKGNTVIVIEHDPDVIKIADHVIEVGPHAGKHGGEIMFEGSYTALLESETLTGKYLKNQTKLKQAVRPVEEFYQGRPSSLHNLKETALRVPKQTLTMITGVAGSGKSTLVKDSFLASYPETIIIDQAAAQTNSRSNPATYIGIMDTIRKGFGKANNVSASLFSYNSKGGCEKCKGQGYIEMNLAFMDAVKTECDVCQGKRFKQEVLDYRFQEKSITEVLNLTVEEALDFFKEPVVLKKLRAMEQVGLGYLTLGQPTSTLSGGECQRMKLASEFYKKGSIYVLDEPSTGLHLSDIDHLMEIMDHLVDQGNTVVVIEHHIDLIKQGDWIVDIGPDGGNQGGQIMFEGQPADIQFSESITGRFIK